MFSEETDWFYRFHRAGWEVWFLPDAEVVHVGGATHGGRMFGENVRGARPVLRQAPRRARGRAGAAAAASSRCGCAGSSSAASAAGCTATRHARCDEAALRGQLRLALPALAIARLLPETGVGLGLRLARRDGVPAVPGLR